MIDGYKTNIEHKADIENCFLSLNPKVATLAQQGEWTPFPLPNDDDKTDFIDGLHTLGGSGDPNLREGIAFYIYMINVNMDHAPSATQTVTSSSSPSSTTWISKPRWASCSCSSERSAWCRGVFGSQYDWDPGHIVWLGGISRRSGGQGGSCRNWDR